MLTMNSLPSSKGISLPSIHEMFPEHLNHRPLNPPAPLPPHHVSSSQRPMQSPMMTSRTAQRIYEVNTLAGPSRLPPVPSARDVLVSRPYASSPALPQSPRMLRSPAIMPVTVPRDPRSRSYETATKSPPLHGIRRPAPPPPSPESGKHPASDPLNYSFNVLRSDPSNSSLEHIASSASYPHKSSNPAQAHHLGAGNVLTPTFRVSVPPPPSSSSPSSNHFIVPQRHRSIGEMSSDARHHIQPFERSRRGSEPYTTISFPLDDSSRGASISSSSRVVGDNRASDVTGAISDDGDVPTGATGKKHICPTCSKRFNRPSSLRIHVNTHTGATPFRCPWPNCGREFNVNSNMRRHYRNHTSPGLSRAQPVEPRRRRRRAQDTDLVFVSADSSNAQPLTPATPESSSISDEDDDEDLSPTGGSFRHGSDYHRSAPHPTHGFEYDTNGNSLLHRRESHLRSSTPMSVSSSGSPPTTPLSEHKYSPSVPYLRSVVTDTTVSTALRPAFTNGRT